MPEISLTTFVDFSTKSFATRVTHVRNTLDQYGLPYQPATDFYKTIREAIQEMHKLGKSPRYLDSALAGLSDKKKRSNYPEVVEGYKKWLRSYRGSKFVAAPKELWSAHGLDVRVNPELALKSQGQKLAVKLYFKADKLSKRQVAASTHLMTAALPSTWAVGVLDTRRGKLHSPSPSASGVNHLLDSEAAAFMALWKSLGGP